MQDRGVHLHQLLNKNHRANVFFHSNQFHLVIYLFKVSVTAHTKHQAIKLHLINKTKVVFLSRKYFFFPSRQSDLVLVFLLNSFQNTNFTHKVNVIGFYYFMINLINLYVNYSGSLEKKQLNKFNFFLVVCSSISLSYQKYFM